MAVALAQSRQRSGLPPRGAIASVRIRSGETGFDYRWIGERGSVIERELNSQQLAGFIAKFDSKHAALIRAVRRALRRRLPAARELVYDNYNFFVCSSAPLASETARSVFIGKWLPPSPEFHGEYSARSISLMRFLACVQLSQVLCRPYGIAWRSSE